MVEQLFLSLLNLDTDSLLILFTSPPPLPQPAAASLLLQLHHITEAPNQPAEAPPLYYNASQLKSCRLPALCLKAP